MYILIIFKIVLILIDKLVRIPIEMIPIGIPKDAKNIDHFQMY